MAYSGGGEGGGCGDGGGGGGGTAEPGGGCLAVGCAAAGSVMRLPDGVCYRGGCYWRVVGKGVRAARRMPSLSLSVSLLLSLCLSLTLSLSDSALSLC